MKDSMFDGIGDIWHCHICRGELEHTVDGWICPRCEPPAVAPAPVATTLRRQRLGPRQVLRSAIAGLILSGLFIAVVGAYWAGFGWFGVVMALVLVLGWVAR